MKKNIKINFVFNIIVNIVNTLISIFATGYLARVLGANNIGLYSYLVSIVSYFTLFGSIGTAKYASREIAYRRDSKEETGKLFEEILLLRLTLNFVAFVIYFFIMHFSKFDSKLIIIISFFIVNEIVDITWFCHGVENFRIIFYSTFLMRIVYLISLLTFVRTSDDFMLYVIIEVAYNLLFNGMLWTSIRKHVKLTIHINPFIHLKESILLFLPSIAVQIYVVLDKTMLGFISAGNYKENSYYSLAEGIVKAFLLIGSSLTKVTAPRIAYLNAYNNKNEISETLYESYRIGWFITLPITVFIIYASDYIVPLYFGAGYEGVIILLKILSPLVFLITFSGITGEQYLIPCKYTNTQTAILFGSAGMNLILNLFLIPRFLSVGASIATICAEALVTINQLVIAERHGILKISQVVKEGRNYIISSICLVAFFVITSTITTSVFSFAISAFIGLLIYLIILVVLKDKIVFQKIQKLSQRNTST